MSLVRRSPDHGDSTQIQISLRSWTRFMLVLEDRLTETGAYVAGPAFSLADIAVGLSVQRWLQTPFDRPHLEAVQAYYRRLEQRARELSLYPLLMGHA